MTCDICPIINNPSEQELSLRLVEGNYWRATLRQSDQSLLATTFVTNKRHVSALGDLSADEWLEFADINSQLESAIRQSFGAQVINTACLMNLAFQQAAPEPHVHWHLKPRYSNPVIFEGNTFIDPAFGHYLDGHHARQPVSDLLATKIAARIKQFL